MGTPSSKWWGGLAEDIGGNNQVRRVKKMMLVEGVASCEGRRYRWGWGVVKQLSQVPGLEPRQCGFHSHCPTHSTIFQAGNQAGIAAVWGEVHG